MRVNFLKLNELAVTPSYAKPGDAGLDLTAVSVSFDPDKDYIEYGTGIAVEIPEGYVGLIYPRSSNSNKCLLLCNSVGVVDSGYRGEIKFRFKVTHDYDELLALAREQLYYKEDGKEFFAKVYEVGDKVGQLMIVPYPTIELNEVAELSTTVRGSNGYGSTGK